MKRFMNQVQKNYLVSKAAYDTLEAAMAEKELKFLQSKGRTEDRIWAIEDEAVFDLLNVEFCASIEDMDADCEAARLALEADENSLIEYALSIAPAKIRETLRYGNKNQIKIREQLIDAIIKFNPSTVPAPVGDSQRMNCERH
jgi:hypothetical protein